MCVISLLPTHNCIFPFPSNVQHDILFLFSLSVLFLQSQASNKRKLDEIVPTLSGTEARDKAQKYLPLMGNQQLIGIILNM